MCQKTVENENRKPRFESSEQAMRRASVVDLYNAACSQRVFRAVEINVYEFNWVYCGVQEIVQYKLEHPEQYYREDDEDIEKNRMYLTNQFLVGFLGELATKKLLGKAYKPDGTINLDLEPGPAKKFNHYDLKDIGYRVGVKTACLPLGAMVYSHSYYPQIICEIREKKIKHANGYISAVSEVVVCGLADMEVLRYGSSKRYLKVRNSKNNSGDKAGFFAFSELIGANEPGFKRALERYRFRKSK